MSAAASAPCIPTSSRFFPDALRLRHFDGIDRSGRARTIPGIAYTAYSAPSLTYADGDIRPRIRGCVAHHVPPEHVASFFAEMRRVVRPGGIVSVIEHNPFNPLTRLAVLRCPFDADAVLISRGSARRLLRTAGLTDIEASIF